MTGDYIMMNLSETQANLLDSFVAAHEGKTSFERQEMFAFCLLYTSDAADE